LNVLVQERLYAELRSPVGRGLRPAFIIYRQLIEPKNGS
jgi:hypothetical protein